jgi:hypothetical protein
MPGRVPGLAGSEDLGGVLSDVHAEGGVILIEREPSEDLRVEQPEVEVRQTQPLGFCAGEIADFLSGGDVAGALAKRNCCPWVGGSSRIRTLSNRLPCAV